MKKYFMQAILILLTLSCLSAQGDTTIFAPLGASWYYNPEQVQKPWGSEPLLARFLVEKDTFLLGYHARVIGCYVNEGGLFYRVDSLTKYVATIGRKVFYKVGNEFVLLFDFNASVGDTIHSRVEEFGLNTGCEADFTSNPKPFEYEIVDESTTDIYGIELKVQFVIPLHFDDGGWEPGDHIVERLGSHNWGGFWWGSAYSCGPLNGFLKCYEDSDIYWHNPYFEEEDCEVLLSTKYPKVQSLFVWPNPFDEYIYLPNDAHDIVILNSLGKKVLFLRTDNYISLGNCPPGIYFISCLFEDQIFSSRIVKMNSQ